MSCPFCAAPLTRKDISDSSATMTPIVVAVRHLLNHGLRQTDSNGEGADHSQDLPVIERPTFFPGDVVTVAPRLWPGINKPGGAAWILRVNSNDQTYDVKYVLTNAIDKDVPSAYVRIANDIPEDRGRRSRKSKAVVGGTPKASLSTVRQITSPAPSRSENTPRTKKRRIDKNTSAGKTQVEDTMTQAEGAPPTQEESMPERLVFLPSTLSDEQSAVLTKFCESPPSSLRNCPGRSVEVVQRYGPAVTHVIVSADTLRRGGTSAKRRGGRPESSLERVISHRTMKYLLAMLGRKCSVVRSVCFCFSVNV